MCVPVAKCVRVLVRSCDEGGVGQFIGPYQWKCLFLHHRDDKCGGQMLGPNAIACLALVSNLHLPHRGLSLLSEAIRCAKKFTPIYLLTAGYPSRAMRRASAAHS